MWNQALRRVVHAEEQQQADRRQQQLTQASSTVYGASNTADTSSEPPVEAPQSASESGDTANVSEVNDNGALEAANEAAYAEEIEDDDDYLQKHLLSRPTSSWSCLEDTQQANCLALNPPMTLIAVGERDGRVTIWDNTSIRVITRELDPTLIAIESPEEKVDGLDISTTKTNDAAKNSKPDADESVENDDASAEEEEDGGSVEENEATEEDDEADVEEDTTVNGSDETKTEDEEDTSGGGAVLTLSDLRVVKTALKVVSQCAWSCNSRWIFAGCEEKSTRRARLCVWDVEAATLVSAFRFDGTITALSPHPCDPKLLVVSYWNSPPVLLDVVSGERKELGSVPLENSEVAQPTPQSNSRHPVLASCARYGRSGKRIYCATSKSTLAILDASTLQCLDSLKLAVIIQFVDLCVNLRETAMLVTSSKGIHEFVMASAIEPATPGDSSVEVPATATEEHPLGLREVALHSTGAVRAPWAVCCFSGGEEFVVGTPVVRHRHVGENGLFTWHRASALRRTTAQHNVGVKDGVLALVWDRMRQSVLAVSTSGAFYVIEEQFTTTWPGAMYPAGFRLITDNELHLDVFDRDAEERKLEREKLTEAAKHVPVDVFSVQGPSVEFPSEGDDAGTSLPTNEFEKPCYTPAIPIAYYHRRHLHQLHGSPYNEDKHFGLGQSVFEPLKGALGKQKPSNSRKSKSSSKKRRRR
ncbi:Retinoblastoma-binding-like protein E [Phytophthora citrophthora]|uniref:Retinoblastoma-binding-like protein E n=1 Tax=Phytophthora citrophthora TaxID=4793 RepID=A0AAD9GSJ3_9STRA|nr:Retinoblastoma-binding-like protein E [Phytophthora citrophthora]